MRPDSNNNYPEGAALADLVKARHRSGLIWRVFFQLSTIVGIIALTALLYNILNQTFGLVAVINEVDPHSLALEYQEVQMLSAPGVAVSEDDAALVDAVSGDPQAISFFGHSYYAQNREQLKAIAVEGVEPNASTVADGSYPLTRPLFLYTSSSILQQEPQVAAFVNYYLQHAGEVIDEVGYFPLSDEELEAARSQFLQATAQSTLADVDPAQFEGDITIAGSSTMLPLTQAIADRFMAAGFRGDIEIRAAGTNDGLQQFCEAGSAALVNASRAVNTAERRICAENGRPLVTVPVGLDAVTVVTSSQNNFLTNVSLEQLREIFTTGRRWSAIDAAWPDEPLQRYLPGVDSGTLDTFADVVFDAELVNLPKEVLVSILAANISTGVGRRLEREQRFFEQYLIFESVETYRELCAAQEPLPGCTAEPRSQQNVYELLQRHVIQPDVVSTWSLVDSLLRRSQIAAEAQREFPAATVEYRSWLTPGFVTSPQNSQPEIAGVRTALLGSLWVVAITILFSFPIGVGAAIYLEEYARDNRLNRFIQTNINNLAGVPSIIYGMLGLAIFVRLLQGITSGAAFGSTDPTTANGRTILSAGLTLGLLILPIIIINAQEAIRAVPGSLRQASYGLGATKWQTIWSHVLPNALPGILTGTILSMSRAIGETAPLVVVGASTFITVDPNGPFAKFTTLPIQIYQWTSRPQGEFRNIAAAAIVVLLILLLSLNASAVFLRNRFSKRLS